MQELLPGQAPEPAGRQAADVLRRLRLTGVTPRLPVALLVSVLSGLSLSLALPPADLGPLTFVAVAPLLWAVRRARPRRAFLCGFGFGAAYLGAVLWWATLFGPPAWLPLALPFGATYGLFAMVVPALWVRERPLRSVLAVAAWWTVIEFLRGFMPFGGFTWGFLGTTQHDDHLLLPLASLTGVWGVSFVVLAVNASLLALADRVGEWLRGLVPVAVAAVLVVAPVVIPYPAPSGPAVDVAVVQGNVPKGVAIDRFLEDEVVAQNHARLHLTLASNPPDLAIWPENSVDRDPATNPDLQELIASSVGEVGAPTLIGAVTDAPDNRFYNELDLVEPPHGVVARYRKQHPVPYGEYVPFRRWLGFIHELVRVPRDMAPGEGPVTFELPVAGRADPVPFTSVICFENAFGDLTRGAIDGGARFLVVATNNASFLRTALSRQHVVWSQIRAAENGRWVVHAAISGISAIIDPRGHVVARTGLFEARILRADIPTISGRTLYTRLGDWFPLAAGAGTAVALLFAWPSRRRRDPPPPLEVRRALVVLPTYNERESVAEAVRRVLAAEPRAWVLVVDDGSPDGTGALVREIAKTEPRVSLLERNGKQGLATAYVEGFKRGLADGFDVVVEMDADLSHQAEELPRLLAAAADHDLVIGSRYVPGGGVTNWSRSRVLLSKAGNLYARTLLGLPLSDATSGYRVYRREVLQFLLDRGITSDGYGFQIELAYRSFRAGFALIEVPITFKEREHGTSKISRRIIAEAVWRVAGWAVMDRFRRADEPYDPPVSPASG